MDTHINPIGDLSVPPWERGVRQGGLMNKTIMTANFLEFKASMEKHRISFVFIFGTLLGTMRDKDFISWDTDVDVACFAEDHKKMGLVIEELKTQGFYIPNRNVCPLHDHFFIRAGEKIEIWWFDKIDNEWIYDNNIRYPKRYFDRIETIHFLDTIWRIPSWPEEFLTLTYGKDWRTPNPQGHYILGRK